MAKVKFNAKQIAAITHAMWEQRIPVKDFNKTDKEHVLMAAQHYLCCAGLADMVAIVYGPDREDFYDKCGAIRSTL